MRYNPLQLDERNAAEALVLQVEGRSDIFALEQATRVAGEYDKSVEHAMAVQNLEERPEPPVDLVDPLEDESEEELPRDGEGGWGSMEPEGDVVSFGARTDAEMSFWRAADD
mmetsp:Transcript_61035/g.142182  ORF Transcript_61035/g.142182 Transcript_61035/m.142182 type:complete len:112 (-) Transcript_61035:5-340(-)